MSVCRKNNLKVDVKNKYCAVACMLTGMDVGMNRLMTEAVDFSSVRGADIPDLRDRGLEEEL
jgi:hypothetical protein